MKFDFNTIQNFDDHINKSIPNYDILIESIKSISEYFYTKDASIYDMGCSTGKLLLSLNTNCHRVGVDNSNLLPKDNEIEGIEFHNIDLNKQFIFSNSCLVYSLFTMQFLNPNSKLPYLQNIYNGLNKEGALILCEKTYQEDGKMQEIMTFTHYDYKLKNFDASEIINKERDLRYIMKPNSEGDIMNMLREVGFKKISCFWQMFNFKGFIAIK